MRPIVQAYMEASTTPTPPSNVNGDFVETFIAYNWYLIQWFWTVTKLNELWVLLINVTQGSFVSQLTTNKAQIIDMEK